MLSVNEIRFLKGLEKLSRDTGCVVEACNCCTNIDVNNRRTITENGGYIFESNEGVHFLNWTDDVTDHTDRIPVKNLGESNAESD